MESKNRDSSVSVSNLASLVHPISLITATHPISLSAIKVEIVFVKNSGIVVAVAMNVVAATS